MRRFNSYGPVDPEEHFAVERRALVDRCVDQLVGALDKAGSYFTIWAPRQAGKTWLMRRAIQEIRARHGERFTIGALSMQGVLGADDGEDVFFDAVPGLFKEDFGFEPPAPKSWDQWRRFFERQGKLFDRPLILLIDECDALPSPIIDRLVSMFRKMFLARGGYVLHGLGLVGVRSVLGVESDRGSPFNVQRSLHVPNLTRDEVAEMFDQYRTESGQAVEPAVVDAVVSMTRGQPGLVSWFGELLTEKYNTDPEQPIGSHSWSRVRSRAIRVEPNNTILNLIKKAQGQYRTHVTGLFGKSNVPFSFDRQWCSYLYTHGVIDFDEIRTPLSEIVHVCRFSCPFIQLRLYNAFSQQMAELSGRIPPVDPKDDLTEVFDGLDLPALLRYYADYLDRLNAQGEGPFSGQPRRADLHLTEAAGHFHLYWWLTEAARGRFVISPEFPTGNGKVDLHIRSANAEGLIEVKSFTQRSDLPSQRRQAAGYARARGLSRATIALFVPTEDPQILAALCTTESLELDGAAVEVTTVAIRAL